MNKQIEKLILAHTRYVSTTFMRTHMIMYGKFYSHIHVRTGEYLTEEEVDAKIQAHMARTTNKIIKIVRNHEPQ